MMPLTVTEETVTKLSQDDVEWSYALREFNHFSVETVDALWQILAVPNPTLLFALHALLSKNITKRIMNSGLVVRANLDLVESADAVVLDLSSLQAAQKVQTMLFEMRSANFSEREATFVVRGTDQKVVIKNRTWATQAVVESLLCSLEHSHVRKSVGMNEAMVSNLLKDGVKLHPHEMDFFRDLINVSFDPVILLKPTYKPSDMAVRDKINNYVGRMATRHIEVDYTQTIPRKVDYSKFVEVLVEATRDDPAFMSVFFCYLYPDEARAIYNIYLEGCVDEDYSRHGAPALETFIDCVAASKTTGNMFLFGDDGADQNLARIERLNDLDAKLDQFAPTSAHAHVDVMFDPPDGSYHQKVLSKCEYTIEEATADIMNVPKPYDMDIPEDARKTFIKQYWRYQRIVGWSEWYRIIRVTRPNVVADALTNGMADLFPDQYQFFHSDLITEDLVDPEMAEGVVVSTQKYMVDALSSTLPKQKLTYVICPEQAEAFEKFVEEGDILLIDLNTGLVDSARDVIGAQIAKTWSSPLVLSENYLRDSLAKIAQFMGIGFGGQGNHFNGWVRVPIPADPASFCLLQRIIADPSHKVSVFYPRKMHETYLDLRIYPLAVPFKDSRTDFARWFAFVNERKTYLQYAIDHFALHLYSGMQSRHAIWQLALRNNVLDWKSHRYKHLRELNFSIDVDIERKKVVKQIHTFTANMSRRTVTKARAHKAREMIRRYAQDSRILAEFLKPGEITEGMVKRNSTTLSVTDPSGHVVNYQGMN
jgi:hypothetical protein